MVFVCDMKEILEQNKTGNVEMYCHYLKHCRKISHHMLIIKVYTTLTYNTRPYIVNVIQEKIVTKYKGFASSTLLYLTSSFSMQHLSEGKQFINCEETKINSVSL